MLTVFAVIMVLQKMAKMSEHIARTALISPIKIIALQRENFAARGPSRGDTIMTLPRWILAEIMFKIT